VPWAIPVFRDIGRGGEEGCGVCRDCSGPEEFTFTGRGAMEGVQGEGGVNCRVSWGIFNCLGRAPLLVSSAVLSWGFVRFVSSPSDLSVRHLWTMGKGVCGAVLWVMLVERGGGPRQAHAPRRAL